MESAASLRHERFSIVSAVSPILVNTRLSKAAQTALSKSRNMPDTRPSSAIPAAARRATPLSAIIAEGGRMLLFSVPHTTPPPGSVVNGRRTDFHPGSPTREFLSLTG